MHRAVQTINFSVSLTDITLSQLALLSFTTSVDTSLCNGLFGIGISVIILGLGVVMIIKSSKIKKDPSKIYIKSKEAKPTNKTHFKQILIKIGNFFKKLYINISDYIKSLFK